MSATTAAPQEKNWKFYGLWALSGLLALAFLASGLAKLSSNPELVANFAHWGFPDGFIYLIGALEVAGAIGLLIPRLAGYAALGLAGIMVGAVGTHLAFAEFAHTAPSAILLVLSAVVVLARRPKLLDRFLPGGKAT